ncbi:MAG: DNA-binding protein [Ignavibacteria bacterium]|nr:DNA-binding protein [Ignavibacteria bacterium]
MTALFDKTEKQNSEFPNGYSISGKHVTCSHCGGEQFQKKDILLNTPGLTFLGLDWANRTAITLICSSCRKIEWFAKEPERIE